MINVLQVLQGGSNFGGVENFLYQYYMHIDQSVVHFDFLFISQDSMSTKWKESLFRNTKHFALNINVRDSRAIYKAVGDFLRHHSLYECIHINTGNLTIQLPCLAAARKAGIKCRIAHSHSTGNGKNKSGLKRILTKVIQKKIFHDSTVRAACSYEAAEHIFGNNVSPDSIIIIPNAIDTQLYRVNDDFSRDVKREFGITNQKVFIQVGNFYAVKNHSFTLDVFHALDKSFENWRLLLVGTGELEDEIKQKAEKIGLGRKIAFTGYRTDVYRLLQGADCLVMPSLWEGFPISTIEAQAAGLAVICSDRIPRSVDVTGNCQFVSLQVNEWINACVASKRGSYEQLDMVKKAGFDISDAAEKLCCLYHDNC